MKKKERRIKQDSGINISGSLVKVVSIILTLSAAYFLTIQSLKIEVAAKADDQTVENLDKKLTNIEVILKETVVSKEQFYRFSKNIEARLNRIEYYLIDKSGDTDSLPNPFFTRISPSSYTF